MNSKVCQNGFTNGLHKFVLLVFHDLKPFFFFIIINTSSTLLIQYRCIYRAASVFFSGTEVHVKFLQSAENAFSKSVLGQKVSQLSNPRSEY